MIPSIWAGLNEIKFCYMNDENEKVDKDIEKI
jgi:hypothetical protein